MIVEPIEPKKRNWMKELRKEKCLTLKGIAELLGISFQHYYDIETGRRNPSIELSLKMADFFDVPVKRLLQNRSKFKCGGTDKID